MNPAFSVLARDGAARTGSLCHRARRGRDPGIHAGGHLRHRQGDDARGARGLGRADHPRQHLSPACCARGRPSSPPTAGCTASCTGAHPILTDSGGFQVFSLKQPAPHQRGGRALPLAGRRPRGAPDPGGLDGRAAARCARTSPWRSMTAPPIRRPRARRAPRWSAPCAGRCAATRITTAARSTPRAGCSASCRAACTASLRLASLEALLRLDWPGLAIGGLAVGESEEERLRRARGAGAAHAGGAAALPHGGGSAGGHRGCRGARYRPVRLRDADAPRPQRPPVHQRRRHQHPQQRLPAPTSRPSTAAATATPAATSAAPTCAISTAATRSSARGSTPSTTCTSTWG